MTDKSFLFYVVVHIFKIHNTILWTKWNTTYSATPPPYFDFTQGMIACLSCANSKVPISWGNFL